MALLKKIELYLRSRITSALSYHSFQQEVSEPTAVFTGKNIKKVLLLRQDRIGDVLVSVPIVEKIKEALPEAKIDILLSHRNQGAKRAFERFADNFYVYGRNFKENFSLIRKLRHNKYDLIIDMYDNASATSSLIVKLSGSTFSLGIEKSNAHVYSHLVPLLDKQEYHITDRLANLLLPFNINPLRSDLKLSYPLSEEDIAFAEGRLGKKEKFRLCINLAGSTPNKYWGQSNHIYLIERLAASRPDFDVVCFGTSEYYRDLETISARTYARIAPAASSIHEWICMISTADMILTPDTAAVHIAAARNIPAICMYEISGREFAGKPWTPYNSEHITLTTESGSLSSIQPNDVLYSIYELEKRIKKI